MKEFIRVPYFSFYRVKMIRVAAHILQEIISLDIDEEQIAEKLRSIIVNQGSPFVPADIQVIGLALDNNTQSFIVRVWSSTFEPVRYYHKLEELYVEFSQPEMPDALEP